MAGEGMAVEGSTPAEWRRSGSTSSPRRTRGCWSPAPPCGCRRVGTSRRWRRTRSAAGASPSCSRTVAPSELRRRRAPCRRVAIGSDHVGFDLKAALVPWLRARGIAVEDVGVLEKAPADYPDIAAAVAQRVARGEADAGIVIDGAGIGSAIAANKVAGIRAAMCTDRDAGALQPRAQRRERPDARRDAHQRRRGQAHRRAIPRELDARAALLARIEKIARLERR